MPQRNILNGVVMINGGIWIEPVTSWTGGSIYYQCTKSISASASHRPLRRRAPV